MSDVMNLISRILPEVHAEAHCDVPCGIYDPTPAKLAAKTVARMTQQLIELEPPKEGDKLSRLGYVNAAARRVKVKEEHAEICKKELQVLWSDFFKPEHLLAFPNLHDTFWKALKLASKCKQEVNAEAAELLVKIVDEIAKMFYDAKKVPERFAAYKTITDKVY